MHQNQGQRWQLHSPTHLDLLLSFRLCRFNNDCFLLCLMTHWCPWWWVVDWCYCFVSQIHNVFVTSVTVSQTTEIKTATETKAQETSRCVIFFILPRWFTGDVVDVVVDVDAFMALLLMLFFLVFFFLLCLLVDVVVVDWFNWGRWKRKRVTDLDCQTFMKHQMRMKMMRLLNTQRRVDSRLFANGREMWSVLTVDDGYGLSGLCFFCCFLRCLRCCWSYCSICVASPRHLLLPLHLKQQQKTRRNQRRVQQRRSRTPPQHPNPKQRSHQNPKALLLLLLLLPLQVCSLLVLDVAAVLWLSYSSSSLSLLFLCCWWFDKVAVFVFCWYRRGRERRKSDHLYSQQLHRPTSTSTVPSCPDGICFGSWWSVHFMFERCWRWGMYHTTQHLYINTYINT